MNSIFTDQKLEVFGIILCLFIVSITLIIEPVNGFTYYTIAGGNVPVSYVYMWINGLVSLWAISRGRTKLNVIFILAIALLLQAIVLYQHPAHIWSLSACVVMVTITLAWSDDEYFDCLFSVFRANSFGEWFSENNALFLAYAFLGLTIFFCYPLALNFVGTQIFIEAVYLKFFCLVALIAIRRGSNHINVVYIVIAAILIELLIGFLDWNPAAYVMNAVMFLIVVFRFSDGLDIPSFFARFVPSFSLPNFKQGRGNSFSQKSQKNQKSTKSKSVFEDFKKFTKQQSRVKTQSFY